MRSEKGPWKDPDILKMIFDGEVQKSRRIVTISDSEERAAGDEKPHYPTTKGSDTSADSGSEAEELAPPKATKTYPDPRLTPVLEEVSCN